MSTVKARFVNGQVVLQDPVNWVDGTELRIEPVNQTTWGMTEEDQGDDPEAVAQWIRDYEAIPPLQMTAEEERDLLGWRQKMKAYNVEAVRRKMEENGK